MSADTFDGALASLRSQGLNLVEIRCLEAADFTPTVALAQHDEALPCGRVSLKGLPCDAFQHPLDKQAVAALKKMKGFDWLVKKFLEYGFERIEHARHMASSVRIGPKQMRRLHEMLHECCGILDVPMPRLFVQRGEVNAFTAGHDHPYMIVMTGALDAMDEDELLGVLAHELGHIKCGHVLYMTMARLIGPIFEVIGEMTFGVGNLVGVGVKSALLAWQRRAELSADRAALLAVQAPEPCVSMLLKLAGGCHRWEGQLDLEEFLAQARAYREGMDQSMVDRFYRFLAGFGTTHPATVERARELDDWSRSDQYVDLLKRDYIADVLPA